MKQEYRHTRPYRGKDPYFENEELTEIDNAMYEATDQGLICIRCGGSGGFHLEGDGYFPCYACGDSGVQSYDSWQLEQTANWEEISCTPV
tara:strand:- start:219 stop:488 length:270 start_codon:yes stop_codon:yes gene_type:complete